MADLAFLHVCLSALVQVLRDAEAGRIPDAMLALAEASLAAGRVFPPGTEGAAVLDGLLGIAGEAARQVTW